MARSGTGLGVSTSSRSPVSPSFGSPSANSTGAVQHETLQNFFQSLLQTNTRGTRNTISRPTSTNPPDANAAEGGNTSAS